jgi:hypothetical protein
VVNVTSSPKEVTYNEFMKILKDTKSGITVKELCQIAIENSKQVKGYLGDNYSTRTNMKLRKIIEDIENNSHIKRIGSNPIVLQFLCDISDIRDTQNRKVETDEHNLFENT